MSALYVIGGQQRSGRSLMANDETWYEYRQGLILRVDPETGCATTCVEYVSPPQARADDGPVLFKCGTLQGDRLYVCTQTEVLIYALPDFAQVGYLSLPCFNDVHHMRPTPEGNLLIANSGLEMVLEVTPAGEVLRVWNTLGEQPWGRFSTTVDYRKGVSTKPHRSHPNQVFYVDQEIWATRFEQRDAICLSRPDRRIDIGIERVHDGLLHDGRLYFTTVNGWVAIADATTLKVVELLDLNELCDGALLGWCRGILPAGDCVWVGFSRIRPTKIRANVSWVRQGFRRSLPTRIACYDLARRRHVVDVDLEAYGLDAVFSILPVPEDGYANGIDR